MISKLNLCQAGREGADKSLEITATVVIPSLELLRQLCSHQGHAGVPMVLWCLPVLLLWWCSSGGPIGACDAELLLTFTMTCCPCLLRLGHLLQHHIPHWGSSEVAMFLSPGPVTLDLTNCRLVGDLEGNMKLPISSRHISLKF